MPGRKPCRFAALRSLRALLAICLVAGGAFSLRPATAQEDPNLAHPHALVSVARDGYHVTGFVTHRADLKAFKHGVVLFPGYPGVMRLAEENGQLRFDLRGNFLIRSRRHWIDDSTLLLVIDAPSDQWGNFSQVFRATPRYGADVAALLAETARRYQVDEWTFVGTSDGSVSAFHVARMHPEVKRLILTASVMPPSRNGPGLSDADWSALKPRLLWVHHENDPCAFTSYRDAKAYAEKTGAPLVTVRGGGPGRGDACQAFTAHGFVGIEAQTVRAMHGWIRTGVVPPDVGP